MNRTPTRQIALIGFGEVGGIFGQDLAAAKFDVAITDILLREEASRHAMLEKADRAGVRACDSVEQAIQNATLVVSAVTCSAAMDVAAEAAPFLRSGQIYIDINSVSPNKKRDVARIIGKSAAEFVEAAVMAPVPPRRLKVPMLLGGARASDTAALLQSLGMNATPVSDRIGVASAIKMCRSVIVKGLEALAVESLLAARRYGAEAEVLASLAASYPEMGWDKELPDYLISRVAEHGRRRASEMRDVAETLADVDLHPWMALATAERHERLVDEMAARGIVYRSGPPFSWRELADCLAQHSAKRVED